MSKEKELEIRILEYIDSISPEELFITTKGISIPGFEDKEVTYKAYELEQEEIIKASIGKLSHRVDKVIPRGLTEKGKIILREHRQTWLSKNIQIFKDKFQEKFAEGLAKWSIIILFVLLGYLIRIIQELI